MVRSLPSGVITRGENLAASFRERRDVEMVVVAVRDQYDVDLRQGVEVDAGIVVPLRSRKGKGRDAFRPDGIDQDVEAGRLDQPARVPDKRQPRLVALNACRRRVGEGTWLPFRPRHTAPLLRRIASAGLREGFRRHAVRIEENTAIEMVRDRFISGTMHRGDWQQKGLVRARGKPRFAVHEIAIRPGLTFLDFSRPRAFKPLKFIEKVVFSTRRPVLEAGGQRPTARCALGRKGVWNHRPGRRPHPGQR